MDNTLHHKANIGNQKTHFIALPGAQVVHRNS